MVGRGGEESRGSEVKKGDGGAGGGRQRNYVVVIRQAGNAFVALALMAKCHPFPLSRSSRLTIRHVYHPSRRPIGFSSPAAAQGERERGV